MLDWGGRTVAAIASGPSLTAEDCELVRKAGLPTIVTNTTFRLCPWADVLFAFDAKWWRMYQDEVNAVFHGKRYGASQLSEKYGARWWYARRYRNSGACAVDFAMTRGAAKIVLLGFDAGYMNNRKHWHDDHPAPLENAATIADWPIQFEALAKEAKKRGAEVVNASRHTRLTCFPRVELESVLCG